MKKIECENYTRIVGYFRPISECNAGKKSEIADRLLYDGNKKCAK